MMNKKRKVASVLQIVNNLLAIFCTISIYNECMEAA